MSTYLAREREKEGEPGRENAGEERGTLLTKFQGVSRHFNVFSLPEDCARRDAHTVYRALLNFYCGRKWIFTLCRESLGFPPPTDLPRCIRSTRVSSASSEPNSSRNWPSERVHPSHPCIHIASKRIFFPVPIIPMNRIYGHWFLDRQVSSHLTSRFNYNNCDEEIERSSCVSFHASCKLTWPVRLCIVPGEMYRNNHGRFFRAFRPRGLFFRYFPTISRLCATNRKGHSWLACKSTAPCKSACNSDQRCKRGWLRKRRGG